MTDEEIKVLQDAKLAAEAAKVEVENALLLAKAEAEKAKADLLNNVEELKLERAKKQEALSKLNINNDEPKDVSTLIEQALLKKEQERRDDELKQAIDEFKASKPEFQADSAGLVFDKFKSTLNKFNLSDVTTKEQARQRLEEVYRYANSGVNEQPSNYDGTPGSTPTIKDVDKNISVSTTEILKTARMDTDKYNKLKGKYPEAIGGLGL